MSNIPPMEQLAKSPWLLVLFMLIGGGTGVGVSSITAAREEGAHQAKVDLQIQQLATVTEELKWQIKKLEEDLDILEAREQRVEILIAEIRTLVDSIKEDDE